MNAVENRFLLIAGIASMGVAVLHVVFIFVGTEAYRYFGAGEDMVRMSEAGSPTPTLLTLAVTVVFIGFALYAFSGTGLIRPLPLLKYGLFTIGAIYTLRGLATFFFGYTLITGPAADTFRNLVFSLVSLAIGLCYLAGWGIAQKQ